MSKHNKVNKDSYVQRGRLTPDEMARERMRQGGISGHTRRKDNIIGKTPEQAFPDRGAPASTPRRSVREESE